MTEIGRGKSICHCCGQEVEIIYTDNFWEDKELAFLVVSAFVCIGGLIVGRYLFGLW